MAVDCDSEGKISVYDVATSSANFSTLRNEVSEQLFGLPSGAGVAIRYLILDAKPEGSAAAGFKDPTKGPSSTNAMYSTVAVSWALPVTVVLHELFHTLGATQSEDPRPAPFSYAGHCIDGLDVMCTYGLPGYSETRCPASEGYDTAVGVPLDCGYDTYFDAVPTPGSWLAEDWNVGGPEDPFLVAPPTVMTGPAGGIGAMSAVLRGVLNPEGYDVKYWFEYGTTKAYGASVPAPAEEIAFGGNDLSVGEALDGLSSSTSYHYRLVAESDAGTVYGADETFATGESPMATASTEAASAVKATQATLNGTVNPEGSATSYYFEYGPTTSYGTKTPVSPASVGSGTSGIGVSQTPTGLSEGSTYHFRLVAKSEAGTINGEDRTFTTLKVPKAITEAATSVVAKGATLNGTVNPGGSATSYYFEYGPTTSYGTKTSPEWVGMGTSNVTVLEPASLSQGTTYHFRLVAEGPADTTYGEDKTFTTLKLPKPTAEAATSVKATQATLNGTVNPEGSATSYYFEYGPTTSYGSKIPIPGKEIGSGTSGVAVSQTPTGLSPGTVYHFRVAAESEAGPPVRSSDRKLTTLKLPQATSEAATSVKATQATLNGTVNPKGVATSYYFEYGKTTSYGTKVPVSPVSVGSGTSNVAVSQTPTDLSEGTTYHFRVAAESAGGTANGEDLEFTTPQIAFSFAFGSSGSGNGQFGSSQGIAIDSSGNLWVVDRGNHRVQKFNPKGEYLSKFGSNGSGNGQFSAPESIAIDGSGNLWVSELSNNRVQKFNSKGEYLAQFGSQGTGNGQFWKWPNAIAIDSSGNLWVTDDTNHRVQKFNSKGEYLSQFGSSGSGNGQFARPQGIAIDSSGNVWVADSNNHRVQKWGY